jgi:hypothetical protein
MCGPSTARALSWRPLTERSHRATVWSIPTVEMPCTLRSDEAFCVTRHHPRVLLRSYWRESDIRYVDSSSVSRFFRTSLGSTSTMDLSVLDLIHIPALTDIKVVKAVGALDSSPDTCVIPCLLPSFRHASGFG